MVKGRDSQLRGHEFEYRQMDIFQKIIVVKIQLLILTKERKNKKKRPGMEHLKMRSCSLQIN